MIKTGYILVISLLLMSCSFKKTYYSKEKVKLLEVVSDSTTITVYYTIPLETMYYSSGIDYTFNKICEQIEIRVIRQKISTNIVAMQKSYLLKDVGDSIRTNRYGINTYLVKIPKQKDGNPKERCNSELIIISN